MIKLFVTAFIHTPSPLKLTLKNIYNISGIYQVKQLHVSINRMFTSRCVKSKCITVN